MLLFQTIYQKSAQTSQNRPAAFPKSLKTAVFIRLFEEK